MIIIIILIIIIITIIIIMASCAKMLVEQSNFYSNREINLPANFYFWNHKEL